MNAGGLAVTSVAFVIAFACVVLMGYAIQRGATCTVAAVDELLGKRSARRLLGMAEASAWVAGGLVIASALKLLPAMPPGYAASGWTIAGGVLLGLGAWINGACVFGAIARLGSGQWAYAATPLGYYAGCLSMQALFAPDAPQRLAEASPLFGASYIVAPLVILAAVVRLVAPLLLLDAAALRTKVWAPHAATTVIGITFFFSLVLAGGTWAYTDLLADLARGMAGSMTGSLGARLALFAALLLGAAWGGLSAGRWRATAPSWRTLAACLAGGALMGWGTLLIPGSNDGLILVGMPLLRPYAWLAFATMCVTIAAAQLLHRRIGERSHFHHGAMREDSAA